MPLPFRLTPQSRVLSKLHPKRTNVSRGVTAPCVTHFFKFEWRCTLQLAQERVPCDASAYDDGGSQTELLLGQINRLDCLKAIQLVDAQGMAVDAVAAEDS